MSNRQATSAKWSRPELLLQRPARIVSGGQTGVDRAALDVALQLGIPCGGWVPKGRRAEDGVISDVYPVREMASRRYADRTRRNVQESDATLILTYGHPSAGTGLTAACARALRRPCLIVDLSDTADPKAVRRWITDHRIRTMNIAGPRESTAPGIGDDATRFLLAVLSQD